MIVPQGHRVLVKPEKKEEKTEGGIILAQSIREKEELAGIFGTVIAIGPNAWAAFDGGEPWAKVGDRVVFSKYGGLVLEDPETKELYRLLNDDDIYCTLEEGATA
jgi:chaperonin GroES